YAKVYISAMDGIDTAKTACKGLASAKGYIRHAIGINLNLRKSPELTFVADDSIEKGMEIFEKLKDASNEN
ncbi:MAG: 30S ribosome-binding factor RbfA, partial [Eubacterium sp.]|nr:30S ribosome-binding factor RbfA [Eubacterium sp.]